MRDIKFRAWLLKETKMVTVDTLSNNKGYGGALEIIIDNPVFDPNKKHWKGDNRPSDSYLNHSLAVHKERNNGDDFILMQYTSLKDKNSKEIYEGDIIKDFLTGMVYEVRFGFCKKYGFNGWYCWNEDHQRSATLNGDYDTEVNSQTEIIGNIYENSELLK
jgi:uncharacterized phage protein (TIGR01671 family)